MSHFLYTPGEWSFNSNGTIRANIEGEERAILMVYYANGFTNSVTQEANGKLAAAAPKMLAALQRADRMFGGSVDAFGCGASIEEIDTIKDIREAIVKAIQ